MSDDDLKARLRDESWKRLDECEDNEEIAQYWRLQAEHARRRSISLEAEVERLREALAFIADTPDPGAEVERSATFYRVHAAMMKQIAAKAIGRETVGPEAMDWAESWWNSEEGKIARAALANQENPDAG